MVVAVDDNVQSLMLIEIFVEKMNLDLITFRSPIKALEFIVKNFNKIEVVITDYEMPKMKGCELIKRVNSPRPKGRGFLTNSL